MSMAPVWAWEGWKEPLAVLRASVGMLYTSSWFPPGCQETFGLHPPSPQPLGPEAASAAVTGTRHTSPAEGARLSQGRAQLAHQPAPALGLRSSQVFLCIMSGDLQNRACTVDRHAQFSPVSTANCTCKQNLQGRLVKRLVPGPTPGARKLDEIQPLRCAKNYPVPLTHVNSLRLHSPMRWRLPLLFPSYT